MGRINQIGSQMILGMMIFLWLISVAISLNHLFFDHRILVLPVYTIGVIGWLTLIITIAYLGFSCWKQLLLIGLFFFCSGYLTGPYLEPPSDPLEHTRFAYRFCEKNSQELKLISDDLWHYSMMTVFMCNSARSQDPDHTLLHLDLLNGAIWSILMCGLFILTRSAGVPARWALIGAVIAFLFMGTNRFSYFSYYSFSAGASSLLICWLWTAMFFFQKNGKSILVGVTCFLICLPVLLSNHKQEAVFLSFITAVWLLINAHQRIWQLLRQAGFRNPEGSRNPIRYTYILLVFSVFFLLPQFEWFQKFFTMTFIGNKWDANQDLVYSVHGIHLFGKIWANRVFETFGLLGWMPILLIVPFFWPGLFSVDTDRRNRCLLLWLLPIIGYGVPLFHFIWASNVDAGVYYRLTYCSMAWVPITFFFHQLEHRFSLVFENQDENKKTTRRIFCTVCLVFLFLTATVRSGPIYGKFDHILMETRPWWPAWKDMISKILQERDNRPVFTDPQTSSVLAGVFNYPIAYKFREFRRKDIIDLKNFEKNYPNFRCIVNLIGFTPSWLPVETVHWIPDVANTSLYYSYEDITGNELNELLRRIQPAGYQVFYEK